MKIILQILAVLPYWLQNQLARLLALLTPLLAKKSIAVVEKNLALCFPEQSENERAALAKAFYLHNARLMLEVANIWINKEQNFLPKITQVEGAGLVNDEKTPIIIVLPHLGNWELFWHWMCARKTPIAMYSPAKKASLDKLIYQARVRAGGEVCATDSKGLLGLLKGVRQGKAMIMLPDQVPTKGSGIYTPFFKRPAYTMTLLHKLAQKSKAKILIGACVRDQKYFSYRLLIRECGDCHWQQPVETFNQQMNQAIERLIQEYPEQYQWSYKRFKRQPDGSRPYD